MHNSNDQMIENFFYSPKGIGKRINEFREIISLFSINDIFSTGNYLLSDNQFMQIETDFKVSINIWSKTAFGSKSQHFDFKKLRIGSFRYEKTIEIHYCKDEIHEE